MLDWQKAQALPWRQRNAEIEAALRAMLAQYDGAPLSTWDIAYRLYAGKDDLSGPGMDKGTPGRAAVMKLSQILTRMAPYLGALAAHDGEDIIRYGRKWKRWQWYGQKREAA